MRTPSPSLTISSLSYHIALRTCRDKPLFTGDHRDGLEYLIRELAIANCWEVVHMYISARSVSIELKASADWAPSKIVKLLKASIAKQMREDDPELRRLPNLWAPGHFVGTMQALDAKELLRYLGEPVAVTEYPAPWDSGEAA
jgi:REP element-mobilizing transposase RayT